MPMRHGKSKQAIAENIREMVRAGHDPKNAVAAALAHAHKTAGYAEGGGVEESRQRSLGEITAQAEMNPSSVSSPAVLAQKNLMAKALAKQADHEDFIKSMSEGGMVDDEDQGSDVEAMEGTGEEKTEPKEIDEDEEDEVVPQSSAMLMPMSPSLSPLAKQAILAKRRNRMI